MIQKIFLIFALPFLLPLKTWACVSHEQVETTRTDFASDILFFKTDEHVVIQQHLTYFEGRPYFNISLCMKNQDLNGFNLSQAANYDFDQHCQMLGSWIPVFTPDGVPVLPSLFAKAFEDDLTKFMGRLERRSVIAPLIDTLKSTLTDFDNLFLTVAGAAIVRQAYIIAPFANTFGSTSSPKSNMRYLRGGGILMALGIFGLWSESRGRQTSLRVHQEKLQEVVTALDHMERELEYLERGDTSSNDYLLEPRIFSAIINALAVALATVEMESGWICAPMNNNELPNEFRQST